MLKFIRIDHAGGICEIRNPLLCSFGIGETIAALVAEAGTAIGSTAAAASTAAEVGAGVETVISTAPALAAAGVTAGEVGAGALGLGALAAPALIGGTEPAAALGGSGGSGLPGAAPGSPPATPSQPLSTAPSPLTPSSTPGPTGGPGASAAGSAPPPGVVSSPDVTQIQPATGGVGSGSNLPTQGFDSGASAAQPGQVGTGAASGAPSNVSAVNVPSNVGPDLSPVKVTPEVNIGASSPETSLGKFIADPSLKSGLNVIGENPTTALSVGALGYDLLKGQQQPPGYNDILGTAKQLGGQANQLEGYLSSGQLPPGIQQSLDAATRSADASIRSQYASRGMSGSSAEAQDVSNSKIAEAGQASNIAQQLYSQGISDAQISTQLYDTIMHQAMQEDADLSSAVGNFAYAMAGGQRPLTPQNTGTI